MGPVVVRHEQRDGCLQPVREHTAQEVGAAGAAQLDGFENGGTSVHSAWHTWRGRDCASSKRLRVLSAVETRA